MSSRIVVNPANQNETFNLTPGQQRTFTLAEKVVRVAPVVLLEGGTGVGRRCCWGVCRRRWAAVLSACAMRCR